MELISLKLFQTGSYSDMERRPVVTTVDANIMNQLSELTHGGTNISRAAIAPVASQIIAPSAIPIGPAEIRGGWGETRCRFIMEFASNGFNGARMRKIVTGYTSHMGISVQKNALDSQMQFFINNVIDMNDSVVPTGSGHGIQTSIRGSDQILFGAYDRHGSRPNDYMLRPGDIFNTASSQSAVMNWAQEGQYADLRMTFMNGAARSRRDNLNPTAYLNRLLRASQSAKMTAEDDSVDSLQYVNDQSAGIANDAPISGDTLLRELCNKYDLGKRGFITWREIMDRWPHVSTPNFIKVQLFGGAHAKQALHQAGQTEHWRGNNIETILATMLGNALPGLLTDNMVYRIGLLITNKTMGGIPDVAITLPPMSLVDGLDLTMYLERLKTQILTELMPGLSDNNMRLIHIGVTADVMDETTLHISVNNAPVTVYTIPSFADNTFSLVTTNNIEHAYGIVADINNLTFNLGSMHEAHGYTPVREQVFTGNQTAARAPITQQINQTLAQPIAGANRWNF